MKATTCTHLNDMKQCENRGGIICDDTCISAEQLCDGTNHCLDKSDEVNICRRVKNILLQSSFLCNHWHAHNSIRFIHLRTSREVPI